MYPVPRAGKHAGVLVYRAGKDTVIVAYYSSTNAPRKRHINRENGRFWRKRVTKIMIS